MSRLPKGMPTMERIWASIEISQDTCWYWVRDIRKNGYGQVKIDGRVQNAHRAVYELLIAVVPKGMHLDHLCRNRLCVNPEHMEVVTPRENTLRGIGPTARNATKQYCTNGHELDGSNLRLYTRKSSGLVRRICKECQRQRVRNYRERLK